MAEATMASSWVDMLEGVSSESKRITLAHSRHFLTITLLFLLPLSFLLIAAPTFFSSLLHSAASHHPPQTLLRSPLHLPDDPHRPISTSTLAISLLYAALIAVLYLSAVATVAHSVRQGFFGRPVKFLSALRSLPSSICRLLLTALLLCGFSALIASLFLLSLRALRLLGFRHLPPPLYWIAAACLIVGAIYLQVNWALAGAVSVIESSWGFEPLRRSQYLVRGMRWAVLCLCLFFSVAIGFMLWSSTLGGIIWKQNMSGMVPVVARVVCASALTMLIIFNSIVTNVVLCLYCKALRGEFAYDIPGEFPREYVCLPVDDRKVPLVVSIVRP